MTVTDPTPVQEYLGSIRRYRLVYVVAVALGAVVLAVAAFLIISHGEISHTTVRTFDNPPASIPAASPSATVRQAWSSTDHAAIGDPLFGGTVVTFDTHTVRGRDGRSGAETWSYSRSDRVVCTAAQLSGVTVAVYANKGNCDELTALNSETGKRMWTRTVDKDGHPVNGHPDIQATGQTLMVTTPSVIYAISANPDDTTDSDRCAGCDRWQYAPKGCTIESAVLGTNGALIRQNCTDPDCPAAPDKTKPTVCGPGEQLMLRDANAGRSDDDKANPDHVKWTLLGSNLRPAAADTQIVAVDPDSSELVVLDQAKGTALGRVPLGGSLAEGVQHVDADSTELFWSSGNALAVGNSRLLWKAATTNVPTYTDTIVAQQSAETVVLDGSTGAVSRRTAGLPSVGPSDRIYPLGTGYLVAGSTTAAYR